LRLELQKPTKEFIDKILEIYSQEEGNDLNKNLLKLFKTFDNDLNKYDVLIKVASLNKIYSTAITNINPVVEQIIKSTEENNTELNELNQFISFVDKISRIEWTNNKGKTFNRNNLSFASKYVHFLSEYKTPIYDSYIWIIIKGYLGQKNPNEKITFKNPENFKEFYSTFEKFKKELNLEKYSNYKIDKFLWQYGKSLIINIESELNLGLEKSKSELKKRIKAYTNNV
jgi:tRNA nucleotidyltransferase/poly(A) polymerase